MAVYSWKVRLGEESLGADASLLAATLLQEHRGVEHASGWCKVATNSSEKIECFSKCRQRFHHHRELGQARDPYVD